jgi:hypothetical protein
MKDTLKEELKSTREKLGSLIHAFKEEAQEADKSMSALWKMAGEKLSGLDSRLDEATENLSHTGDEARLQAHLAFMEAKTAWQSGSKAMEAFAQRSARSTKTQFDHAKVQAHLGKMEIVSYIDGPGKALIKRFKLTKDQVERESVSALREMGKHMDDIAQHMRREV